jgi:hypothetical protein
MKQKVGEVLRDDAVMGHDVAFVTVDPLLGSAGAAAGQMLPSGGQKLSPAAAATTTGQALFTDDKVRPSSALGTAPAPKAPKLKKIAFKKSVL